MTFTSACILHIDCERNGIICSHCFLVGRGFSIGESSVAQSVSEREQRFDFLFIRPAITYENIFPIDFINGVPSMFRLCQFFFITRIFAQFMSTYIFQFCRESERKFSWRIGVSHQYGSKSCSGFRTQEPTLNNSRHFIHPRHSHCIAGDIDNNQVFIHLCQFAYHSILRVRQTQRGTVRIFTILMIALVQATEEDNIVGIFSHLQSLCEQFIFRTVVFQILTGFHAVILSCRITYIPTGIYHFRFWAHTAFQSIQRRNLIFHFQRRTTTAHSHHLYRIFTDHCYFLCFIQIDRQYVTVVLQQDNSFFSYLTSGLSVFGRT